LGPHDFTQPNGGSKSGECGTKSHGNPNPTWQFSGAQFKFFELHLVATFPVQLALCKDALANVVPELLLRDFAIIHCIYLIKLLRNKLFSMVCERNCVFF
jgi:hypothetical protein